MVASAPNPSGRNMRHCRSSVILTALPNARAPPLTVAALNAIVGNPSPVPSPNLYRLSSNASCGFLGVFAIFLFCCAASIISFAFLLHAWTMSGAVPITRIFAVSSLIAESVIGIICSGCGDVGGYLVIFGVRGM